MDAAEDDSDVRLQKVAGDLIGDFDSSLEPFLWRTTRTKRSTTAATATTTARTVRARVRTRDTLRMAALLDPFQEYPQLLDAHLARWLPLLAEAFLESVAAAAAAAQSPTATTPSPSSHALTQPLQAAIALLLYTLCKVRGEKVVVGFLPVATRHLEPLLGALEAQAGGTRRLRRQQKAAKDTDSWTWQERYIVLMWLSQLLLAPFDLSTISTTRNDVEEEEVEGDGEDGEEVDNLRHLVWPDDLPLPSITVRVLPLALRYLAAPGKERDAARALLVRLALRHDMQQLGVRDALVTWALAALAPAAGTDTTPTATGPYYYIGILSFLAGLLSAAAGTSDLDVSLADIFRTVHAVAEDDEDNTDADGSNNRQLFASIRSSAVARKTMVKALRAVAVRCIQQQQQTLGGLGNDLADIAIETTIGYLLGRLADNDTPVRFAASKALSVITLRLTPDMASQVIDAVLEALERNVLYTLSGGGSVVAANVLYSTSTTVADLTAVDPLEWHGLVLTLAHLLYRRAPPLAALPAVAAALLRGLAFERRSLSGSATGTNVRDAACFGIWALARRYATTEVTSIAPDLLQTLATHLVVAASLDPAGNIRRGSSAALQELVGRHPDTVRCGIALVQAVDYHAVALRARAARTVAVAAAALAPQPYGAALLRDGLLGWRGLADADAGARRVAAASFGTIAALLAGLHPVDAVDTTAGQDTLPLAQTIDLLIARIQALRPRQVEELHGLLLALASVLDEFPALAVAQTDGDHTDTLHALALTTLGQLHAVLQACRDATCAPAVSAPAQRRPDLLVEAACRLVVSSFPVLQAAYGSSVLLDGPTLVAKAARVPLCAVFSETVAAVDAAAQSSAPSSASASAVHAFTDLVALCISTAAGPANPPKNQVAGWLIHQEPDVVAAASDAALVLLVLLAPRKCSDAEDARSRLIRSWADVVCRPSSTTGTAGLVRGGRSGAGPVPRVGAKLGAGTAGSGYVFALTKALPLVAVTASSSSPSPIVQAILDRWAADRAIDTRVALLQALAQSPAVLATQATQAGGAPTMARALRAVLATGLDDYTTDARGDVGSHVRLQALRATQVLWGETESGGQPSSSLASDMLFLRVLRLAAEKLDRVRVAAQAALVQVLVQSSEATAVVAGHRLRAETFSSKAYFGCLLGLLDAVSGAEHPGAEQDALQRKWMTALMRGYATSADTGNEELVVASRAALVDYLGGGGGGEIDPEKTAQRRRLVWQALLCNLPATVTAPGKKPMVPPDRTVVPTLEIVAFLFYAGVFTDAAAPEAYGDHATLCRHVRTAADKAGSVRKLEACIKVYGVVAAATSSSEGAAAACRQLAALLQHPWPRVRTAVVDELWGLGLQSSGTVSVSGTEEASRSSVFEALKGVDWTTAEPVATEALAAQLGLVQ